LISMRRQGDAAQLATRPKSSTASSFLITSSAQTRPGTLARPQTISVVGRPDRSPILVFFGQF
jgi:hypothetical protein